MELNNAAVPKVAARQVRNIFVVSATDPVIDDVYSLESLRDNGHPLDQRNG
jgi:hypothetical protein